MLREKWFKSSACALMLMLVKCTDRRWVHRSNINISTSALVLNHFSSIKTLSMYWLNSHTPEKQNHLLIFVKNYKMAFKITLNTKYFNSFTQWKNGSVNVTSTSRSLSTVRWAQWTFSIHSAYLLKNQSEIKKLSWNVWISICIFV